LKLARAYRAQAADPSLQPLENPIGIETGPGRKGGRQSLRLQPLENPIGIETMRLGMTEAEAKVATIRKPDRD